MTGHVHAGPDLPAAPPTPQAQAARRRLKWLLAAVLLPLLAATLAGAALLFHERVRVDLPGGLGPADGLVRAQIEDRTVVPCPTDQRGAITDVPTAEPGQPTTAVETQCVSATLRLTSGPNKGNRFAFDVLSRPTKPFPDSGGVVLAFQPGTDGGGDYVFVDVQRDQPLLLLGALFAAAVLLVGRWTGLRALVGLATSLLVVTLFVLPALLAGENAVLVALVGSAAVMFGSLYLAHGITIQTSIAVLGTLASLALTVLLAEAFVPATGLTGAEASQANLLTGVVAGIDLRGLLLAGIVIGSLGVLDDVTVTQAAAVWELHVANPLRRPIDLYRAGLRIGRHHIGATVNTLALAYVGASLPLFVVFSLVGTEVRDALTREVVAQELVRAAIGSLGLVAAVPLTTVLAVFAVGVDRAGRRAPGAGGAAEPAP